MRLILLIAIIGIGLILWHKFKQAKGEQRKKLAFMSAIGGVIALLLILAVTGHLNIITAAIAGLVALLPRVMSLAKYLPFANRIYQQTKQSQSQANNKMPPSNSQQLSAEEAMKVLGLRSGFTQQELIQAHRRMMQKNHPDHGGSDYLAAQINQAKKTLLS